MKNNKGFTIVELLIVIVVIGILAAITIVAYNGIQTRASVASAQSDLRNLSNVAQTHMIDGKSIASGFTWKSILQQAGLYDQTDATIGGTKSFVICANQNEYIIGVWRPLIPTGSDADAETVYYVNSKTGIQELDWNYATPGETTLEKFCTQAPIEPTFRAWSHSPLIRDS